MLHVEVEVSVIGRARRAGVVVAESDVLCNNAKMEFGSRLEIDGGKCKGVFDVPELCILHLEVSPINGNFLVVQSI